MKQIAVCIKETNDGYSSDFLYKSNNFVNEGVVTDIRLSWISGVFDSSTNDLREKLKDTTPLKFIKYTREYLYLVIMKLGQTSRWNDNVSVWCQIPLGVFPAYADWSALISNIEGVLNKKEALTNPESWKFLDSLLNKSYACDDVVIDYTEGTKPYACRGLSLTNDIYGFLKNYYQPGYQNYEAVILLDEKQKESVTCKSSVKDLSQEPLDEMVVFPVLKNEDGWLPYNVKNEILDKALLVGKSESFEIYWKKAGCKTIVKKGNGSSVASFQIEQNEYRKIMNKSSFKIRDEKGLDISSFSVKIDGRDVKNGEIDFPMDYNLSKAKVDISLQGVSAAGKGSSSKIIFGIIGIVLGLIIGLVIGFSRTPKVVEVPVQQARPFSCVRYFEENKNVWEKASMDSCSDLKGVFELLASYDFKALQEKADLLKKYDGLKDLAAMIEKSAELGFKVSDGEKIKKQSIVVQDFKNTMLKMYLESNTSWFKEELDVFAPDLFDALYAYDKDEIKQYSTVAAVKNILDDCFKAGKSHPRHYSNAEEINVDMYVKSFSNATVTAPSTSTTKAVSSKPAKDYSGQGADD
ncbi:MAG: hypothetical protein MJ198_06810 [Bacteroidales bacterium]|nr:hypothetical protein [Bacteroidales bacterium]